MPPPTVSPFNGQNAEGKLTHMGGAVLHDLKIGQRYLQGVIHQGCALLSPQPRQPKDLAP